MELRATLSYYIEPNPGLRFDAVARYALIVTIRAPGAAVDIFTPVEAVVAAPIAIET